MEAPGTHLDIVQLQTCSVYGTSLEVTQTVMSIMWASDPWHQFSCYVDPLSALHGLLMQV